MNSISNSMDKPSLHWSKSYFSKVSKMVDKNSKYNFSTRINAYKKVPSFYEISWKDFLPCFIGWCHSLFTLAYTYGLIRSTTIFNKDLYKKFRKKVIFSLLAHYIFGPMLIFCIFFFCPMISVSPSSYFSSWSELTKLPLNEWSNLFAKNVIEPVFNGNAWWIALLIFCFLSCLNVSTFITNMIFNKKNDSYMRLIFLEDNLKMKLTSFKKK